MTAGLARAAVAALALLTLGAAPDRGELTGADGLVRVYDHILNAQFASAASEMTRACGPAGAENAAGASLAPEEACDVLAATSTWWRILLDPQSRAFDPQFSREVEYAIKRTEAWTARDPDSAEAHFYNGAAYAARVQWRVLRDEKLAAARDGKRIKQALERAIALDPDLDDAYFGIGLYKYSADIAPAAAKVLRFLLMLPGGDKTEGLAQMQRARADGKLLQGEADYQLHILYLWYERRPDLAVELLEALRDRYPGNPLFAAQLATVQDDYLHDVTASLATWRALLDDARADRVNEAGLAEAEARLGIARHLDGLDETDLALEQLRRVIAAKPAKPVGSLAAAYLALGEGEDRLGHHDAAVAAYRLAAAAAPMPDSEDIRRRATERMKRAPDEARAEAYRLSIDGLRRLEKGDAVSAEAVLAHSLALDPRNAVARYRYGRAALAKKDEVAALAAFEATIRAARDCPAPIAAAAYLDAARLHERMARREQAIDYYRTASTWFGGGRETRAAAERALARLHAPK